MNVGHGFNLNGEPHKLAHVGQAAWIFRTGAVPAGRDPVAIPLSRAARLQAGREKRNSNIPAFLQAVYGYDPNTAFVHPVSIYRSETDRPPASVSVKQTAPFLADTGELTYDPAERIYKVHSDQAAGLFGFLGARPHTAGPLSVEVTPGSRGFAAVLLTPLDGQSLARSRRLLLTLPGYTLRSRPGADPPQPQALVNYPGTSDWFTLEPEPGSTRPSGNLNGGAAPTWMERIEAAITLELPAIQLLVYPLDSTGARLDPLPASNIEKAGAGFRFRLQTPNQPLTPWYELVLGPPPITRRR